MQGNDIHFELANKKFAITYCPVPLGNGAFGFDEIGIFEEPGTDFNDEDELDIAWFKTVDEMLDKYIIDGCALGELLDKIEDIHGTPCA